jgi:hypothetical protein
VKKTNQLLIFCSAIGLGVAGGTFYFRQKQQAILLQHIAAVETRLAANNRLGAQEAVTIVRSIRKSVYKNQNQAKDVQVLKQSQQILQRTQTITDTLRMLQRQLRAQAGEAPTDALRYPAASTPRAAAVATQLARHLDRYTTFIRIYVPEAGPLTQASPAGNDWLFANRTPLAAALARLSGIEVRVRRYAREALNRQAQKVGSYCGFDRIGAMAVASANTVAPGAMYEAQLLLVKGATSYLPEMMANGKVVEAQSNGEGLVEINVPRLQPGQPDTVRAQWRGSITAHTLLTDSTWQLEVPYLIVKPHSL